MLLSSFNVNEKMTAQVTLINTENVFNETGEKEENEQSDNRLSKTIENLFRDKRGQFVFKNFVSQYIDAHDLEADKIYGIVMSTDDTDNLIISAPIDISHCKDDSNCETCTFNKYLRKLANKKGVSIEPTKAYQDIIRCGFFVCLLSLT
ncbi:MAG: hypothetical protein DRP74_07615 [Candidatus Omnitrophota bacterium]|nr:MAG: hypothetical protein DRP74_07615 [Candidatus Omnitrophota bacterium]